MRLHLRRSASRGPAPITPGAGPSLVRALVIAAALALLAALLPARAPTAAAETRSVAPGPRQPHGPLDPPLRPDLPPLEAPAAAMGVTGLHAEGITGAGVTVAVIDTGLAPLAGRWERQADGSLRLGRPGSADGFIVYRDFLAPAGAEPSDPNGHGTHVAGTIANNRPLKSSGKGAMGVAPGVSLVVARALEADGSGAYETVIAAIDWVLAERERYGIRVLNLSLYAPIRGPYWADPLGRAVMRAWQAGIVVVAPAGNGGPAPATVTVPGNVPYVITVGAAKSPQFTASGAYERAPFSANGPSESAFPKPDLLVPAVRVIAPMPDDGLLAREAAAGRLSEKATLDLRLVKTKRDVGYYQLSGTSMAAAAVSGLVALLLDSEPGLSNDQVKYRLMATARLAADPGGAAAYSIWEQGAGLAQAEAALAAQTSESANAGMDLAVDLDLEGDLHYWGQTSYDPLSGSFSLPPLPGSPAGYLVWSGAGRAWAGGLSWSGDPQLWAGAGRAWAGAGRAWAGAGRAWAGSAELWAGAGRAWAGAQPPTLRSPADAELGEDTYLLYLPALSRAP